MSGQRARGADVLQVLVQLNENGKWASTAREVAERLGLLDGRAVTPQLNRLVGAGLARRPREPHTRWGTETKYRYVPTDRGREVDAVLDRIVAARGGTFQPQRQAGIKPLESVALGSP